MSASDPCQDNGTVLYVGKDRKKADLKQWFEALPRSCLEAINSTLSHYVLRARSYVVIINTLFYKGILR